MLLLSELANDGRPFFNDDLDALQATAAATATATLPGLGPVILSGCAISAGVAAGTYNIAPGLVWLDALRQFPGAEAVALPGWLAIGGAVMSGPRLFETGDTKNAYVEYQAQYVTAVPAAQYIALTADNPGLHYWQAVAAKSRTIGETQLLGTRAWRAADYDATGLGKPGTEAFGWALANGQHNTDDMRGMFVRGQNPDRLFGVGGVTLTTTAVGEGGGEETHQLLTDEMPVHNHTNGANTKILRTSSGNDSGSNFDYTAGELNIQYGAEMLPAGGGQAHNNLPPYIVLPYRQWVGY